MTRSSLLMWDSNGGRIEIPITDVGGTLRFAVGEPGQRSSIWNIWAPKKYSDVYLASRTIAGMQKFSLHESGDWRYAWTSQYMDSEEGSGLEERIIDQWRRPEPDADGLITGPVVRVRAEDVPTIDDTALAGEVQWIPAPPEGCAVNIVPMFLRPNQEVAIPGGGLTAVGLVNLVNDEAVLVMAKTSPLADEVRKQFASDFERATTVLPPELLARRGEPGLRIGLFGWDGQGNRHVWDTAFI